MFWILKGNLLASPHLIRRWSLVYHKELLSGWSKFLRYLCSLGILSWMGFGFHQKLSLICSCDFYFCFCLCSVFDSLICSCWTILAYLLGHVIISFWWFIQFANILLRIFVLTKKKDLPVVFLFSWAPLRASGNEFGSTVIPHLLSQFLPSSCSNTKKSRNEHIFP